MTSGGCGVARRATGVKPGAGERGRPAASNSDCDMRDLLRLAEAQNVALVKQAVTARPTDRMESKGDPTNRHDCRFRIVIS